MKKIFTILLMMPLLWACSSNDDDYSNKSSQEILISGYKRDYREMLGKSLDVFKFYFFEYNKVKTFEGKTISTNLGENDYADYQSQEADPIYKNLIENNTLLLPNGATVHPEYSTTTSSSEIIKTKPIRTGKYLVVAIANEFMVDRRIALKYACLKYELVSQFNEPFLTVFFDFDYSYKGQTKWMSAKDEIEPDQF